MKTDLPPEAFTKETLQEAFNWLQDQGEAVQATVHTPERLVSLYRKSQRLNDLDAPVSSKKFVDDLKSLATSLDQFSSRPLAPAVMQSVDHQSASPRPTPSRPFETYHHPEPSTPLETEREMVTETQTQKTSFEVTTHKQKSRSSSLELDELTKERIQKVKARFNLGSDAEALRMLVALGYEKFAQFP